MKTNGPETVPCSTPYQTFYRQNKDFDFFAHCWRSLKNTFGDLMHYWKNHTFRFFPRSFPDKWS